jgi:MFS family permease
MQAAERHTLRHNILVNLVDGGFFGFAVGFASFSTIIPLFVSQLTDSALLIGLIPAIHSMGWQLPQLFNARQVSRQKRFLGLVLKMTIQERLPFIGLAIVAWLAPLIGPNTALVLIFALLVWQGLGAGFAANPWQSMIGKIFPSEYRGTFLGGQSAAANLMASLSAILAGLILQRLASPLDFTLTFILCSLSMAVSWFFLSLTREVEHELPPATGPEHFWSALPQILRQDLNLRWFLLVRMLSQLAVIGTAFYTVYAVNSLGMDELTVGILTSVLLGVQILANPIMGWLGDHWSHRGIMAVGLLASILSALLAWWAPSAAWFFPVMILTGIANVAIWTISIAMIQQFGREEQRPIYIGLSNTLVAPFTILAPFLGGWLAELNGYTSAFSASAVFGLITLIILVFIVKEPARVQA